MADVTVRAVLQAQDNLTRVIDKVDRQLNRATNSASRLSGQFGTMGKVLAGAGIAVGITQMSRALTRFVSDSVSAAGEFDRAMRSVQAKTGATEEQFKKLTEQARDLGRTTLHTAQQAADAQAFLAQAGLKTNEVYDAMPGVLNLATAGTLELSRAADISSNILVGFNKNASDMNDVADIMATIAASANTNIEQLGTAMSYVAPVAASAGVSIEKTSAIIGALSDAGIQASKAGTGLRGMIVSLSAPSNKAQESLDALGLSFTDSSGKLLDFDVILERLAPHYENTALMAQLFGRRQIAAAQAAISARDKIADLTVELENSEGAAAEMAETMGSGMYGDLKRIESAFGEILITIGEGLAPEIKAVANLMQGFVGILVGPAIDRNIESIGNLRVQIGILEEKVVNARETNDSSWPRMARQLEQAREQMFMLALESENLVRKEIEANIYREMAIINTSKNAREINNARNRLEQYENQLTQINTGPQPVFISLLDDTGDAGGNAGGGIDTASEAINKFRDQITGTNSKLLEDMPKIREAWSSLPVEIQKSDDAIHNYADVLEEAARAGVILTDAEIELINESQRRLNVGARLEAQDKANAEAVRRRTEAEKRAAEAQRELADWGDILLGINRKALNDLPNAMVAWSRLTEEQQRTPQAIHAYADALEAALHSGAELTDQQMAIIVLSAQEKEAQAQLAAQFKKNEDATQSFIDKLGGLGQIFTGVMGVFHGFLDGGWKGGLTQMANYAMSFLPPGMAQAAQAALGAFKAVWNKFFKKPSEAELQARESFSGMQQAFKDNIGEIPQYQEYVNSLLSQGWDRNLAEVKAGFDYWAQQAGLGFEESGRLYTQYQDAIKAGDNEEVARIEAVVQGWRDRGAAISEAAQAEIDAAQEAAEAHRQFMDGVFSSVIGAWDRAKAAGEQAFTDSMALHEQYNAAIEEGDAERAAKLVEQHGTWITSEESALAQSEHNQNVARQKLLDAEKAKYVRLAAFEAALEAIRSGNAEGAAEAARLAAEQTAEAWDTALGAVAVADEIANNTVEEGATTTADHVIEEAERTQQETIKAANEAAEQQAQAAELAELERIQSANDAAAAEILAAEKSVEGINAAFEALEDHTVAVTFTTGEMPEFEGRAAGGPVTAGVPYVVGERGPELFVPRRDGGVIPNHKMGGIGTINIYTDGTHDGLKVAETVAEYLPEVLANKGVIP